MRAVITVLFVLASCTAEAPSPPGADSSAGESATLAPEPTGPATGDELDAAVSACLRETGVPAVLRVSSSQPDCSGVGWEHVVFEVTAAGAMKRAHLACPLVGACQPLAGATRRVAAGDLFVAVLRPQPEPARVRHCVSLPATDAAVGCAVPVTSLEAGMRYLEAAK